MSTLRDALTALKDEIPNRDSWKSGPNHFPTRHYGICGNVMEYFYLVPYVEVDVDKATKELDALIVQYTEETGIKHDLPKLYPVDGEEEYLTGFKTGILWYNPRRLALLDWLLEHCK